MGQYEKWSNIAPFPFGSLVGQIQNVEQYGKWGNHDLFTFGTRLKVVYA